MSASGLRPSAANCPPVALASASRARASGTRSVRLLALSPKACTTTCDRSATMAASSTPGASSLPAPVKPPEKSTTVFRPGTAASDTNSARRSATFPRGGPSCADSAPGARGAEASTRPVSAEVLPAFSRLNSTGRSLPPDANGSGDVNAATATWPITLRNDATSAGRSVSNASAAPPPSGRRTIPTRSSRPSRSITPRAAEVVDFSSPRSSVV